MAFPPQNCCDVQNTDKKRHPTQRDSPQLYVFSANSTRFGPTPCASVKLHAFRSNSTRWRATPRSGDQLHALLVNFTLFLSTPPYGSLLLTSLAGHVASVWHQNTKKQELTMPFYEVKIEAGFAAREPLTLAQAL